MKKILIVDDETDIVKYLSTFLMDNNFEVIPAFNGKECFEKAVSEKPDLITLDITMPLESGVRAFRDLQEDENTRNIPVIIITGVSHDFENFISTRKQVHPPIAYFEKPINKDELLNKINEILKIR
ncbi:MAG: response regulator with CheY-like receiver, AAA-type ATPase, and DNA-binding domain [Ignavibacteria bacterium]|nr:response regulator with CheY-like receiver, AAA-type ATPase, and DNA-binding domain [Ignavibacteria bacterium]